MPESVLSPTHWAVIPTYGNEVTGQLSNKTLLSIRVGGTGEANVFRHPSNGDLVTPNHVDLVTGFQTGGAQFIQRQHSFRHSQAVKLSHYVDSARVSQQLRGGVQTEFAHANDEYAWPSGVQYQDSNGVPTQALYRDPWVQGSKFATVGLWAEDQLTLSQRLTVSIGARWDRMQATSQDLRAADGQLNLINGTVAGLGELFTWKVASPRFGFNFKLTDDGKTVVRGDFGRAYRQIFLNDFAALHPGVSPITLKRYDPATQAYSTLVSVTAPLANISFDRNIRAPYTDQYAVGMDRQLTNVLAVSVSYVHKDGKDQVGWRDIGGTYAARDVTLPNGQVLSALALVNSPSARVFQITNGPGYFSRYNGLLLTVTKRLSQRWQANIAYTESRTNALQIVTTLANTGAAVVGQDPNDLINRGGPDTVIDRPHMLTAQATYDVPKIGVLASANVQIVSGLPFAPTATVALPQGTRSVMIAPPGGDYRFPRQDLIALRLSKVLPVGPSRKLELIANINNILQNEAYTSLGTTNLFSATYGQPTAWVEPRNMNVMVKMTW